MKDEINLDVRPQEEKTEDSQSLANIRHTLRTPLNHIIGYSEMLLEEADERGLEAFTADLRKIHAAGKQLLVCINELLEPAIIQKATTLHESKNMTTAGLFRETEPAGRSLETDATADATAKSGQILVVDDNESNRDMLSRRLIHEGYAVRVAANGQDALQLLKTESVDLMLLDVMMPEMDGYEVLKKLKADNLWHDIPVIMISALDQLEGIVRCIELGAEDYVAKPFNPVFLRARIGAGLEKKRLRDREISYLRQIQEEKHRSEELLHIILPQDVAEELKATNRVQPRRFENVGVLFCDIAGFTRYCDQHPPEEVLPQLQAVVEAFEELITSHGLEKIKTIGDSFMATAGLRTPAPKPALACVQCGWDMIAAARRLPPHWQVRVGVHVGPVIAGVVGHRKYQYDLWGDTVNLAARMEEAAQPGSVCVTTETCRLLKGHCQAHPMGRMEIKGKGQLDLVRVESPSDRTL